MRIEITKDLNVTPEEFYDYMISSMISQISSELGRSLNPQDLHEGYSHKTVSKDRKGRKETVRFTIRKAKRPEEFKVVHSSAKRKTGITYRFAPSKKGCLFTCIHHVIYSDPSEEPKGFKARMEELRARTQMTSMISQAEVDCRKQNRKK